MRWFSVTTRLAVLLACFSTLPLLAVGDSEQIAKAVESALRQRVSTCEEIAVSCTLHLRRQDQIAVESQIRQFAERSLDLASVRLVRFDGLVIQSIGDHATHWTINAEENSTPTNIRVPLVRNNRNWGSFRGCVQGRGSAIGKLCKLEELFDGLCTEFDHFWDAVASNAIVDKLVKRRAAPCS